MSDMIRKADRDGNGEIDKDEFMQAYHEGIIEGPWKQVQVRKGMFAIAS